MVAVATRSNPGATSSSETSVTWKTRDTRFCVSYVDPFGDILTSSGALADENPFRFSTKYHDDETGLVYFGFRHYSPRLGRWVSRDPIEESDGLNVYCFAVNSPIAGMDFLGLAATSAREKKCCDKKWQDNPHFDLRLVKCGKKVVLNHTLIHLRLLNADADTGDETADTTCCKVFYWAGNYSACRQDTRFPANVPCGEKLQVVKAGAATSLFAKSRWTDGAPTAFGNSGVHRTRWFKGDEGSPQEWKWSQTEKGKYTDLGIQFHGMSVKPLFDHWSTHFFDGRNPRKWKVDGMYHWVIPVTAILVDDCVPEGERPKLISTATGKLKLELDFRKGKQDKTWFSLTGRYYSYSTTGILRLAGPMKATVK